MILKKILILLKIASFACLRSQSFVVRKERVLQTTLRIKVRAVYFFRAIAAFRSLDLIYPLTLYVRALAKDS